MPPWRGVFAWFGLVPLLWAVLSLGDSTEPHPLRRGFLLAYLSGVLWYVGNCYWIRDTMLHYGDMPPLAPELITLGFSLVLGLYFGLFGWGLLLVRRATGSVRLALAFAPFLWTALELAGARITSVPWDQLGYSQVDNGLLNQLAPWTGVYGISFLLVGVNALLAGAFLVTGRSKSRFAGRWAWGICGLVLLASGATGVLDKPPQPQPTMEAVLIQPNLDVANTGYWQGAGEWDQHMREFAQLGGETCKSFIDGIPQTGASIVSPSCPPQSTHPDLVVWPEAPAPFFEPDPRFQHSMTEIARTEQAPLIVNGIGAQFTEGGWLNYVSAMIYDADGKEVGRYDKIHLVPFGEYIPFARILFFAHKLTGKVSNFTPGTERSVFHLSGRDGQMHRYGVFICYEAVFADEVRQFARNGAEVFVNISDDGWYGDTSAPWQHLNMARMRAIENRRWLLRDTNNGVTASIDPYGRVRESIPRHRVDALPAGFAFRDDITFYTAHGDVFAWVCAIISIAFLVWAGRRSIRREQEPSGS
ncbi:MAG TPA: apolipoprotein N-acyltransferase [Terracidiphilus sp.]|nr:apolipoprotein N-acyltransferase [Terracidiphilus sp.]